MNRPSEAKGFAVFTSSTRVPIKGKLGEEKLVPMESEKQELDGMANCNEARILTQEKAQV